MHEKRTFNICNQEDMVKYAKRMLGDDPEKTGSAWLCLAHVLTQTSSVLCAAYEIEVDGQDGTIIFANDAISEDGAQEYAVIIPSARYDTQVVGHQVESITASWMDVDTFLEWALECFSARDFPMKNPTTLNIDNGKDHRCQLCA